MYMPNDPLKKLFQIVGLIIGEASIDGYSDLKSDLITSQLCGGSPSGQ